MASSKSKKASPKPVKPAAKSGSAKSSAKGGSDVERRWKEYWACRKQLEDSVEKVRAARETLQKAQDEERARRTEFDEIRRSLTTLLDVEPASSQQRQQPVALPQPVPQASQQGPKAS